MTGRRYYIGDVIGSQGIGLSAAPYMENAFVVSVLVIVDAVITGEVHLMAATVATIRRIGNL